MTTPHCWIRAAPLFAFVLLALNARAADGPDILGIFDQMVISRAAADICAKPDRSLAESFQRNFLLVSARALEEVRRRQPSMPASDATKFVANREAALSAQAKAMAKSRGCGDTEISVITRRFDVQARWDPQK
jgi:hypothetical protein